MGEGNENGNGLEYTYKWLRIIALIGAIATPVITAGIKTGHYIVETRRQVEQTNEKIEEIQETVRRYHD